MRVGFETQLIEVGKPLSWSVCQKNASAASDIPWVVGHHWHVLSHSWRTASQIAMVSLPAMFMFITFIRSDYESLNANLILVLVLLTQGSKQNSDPNASVVYHGTLIYCSPYQCIPNPQYICCHCLWSMRQFKIKTKNDLPWVYIRQNGLCSMAGQPTDKIVKSSFSLGNIATMVNLVFYALYSFHFSLLNPL